MDFPLIDPHIHVISRTVTDLMAMRAAGVVAVIEPSFWLGQPRTNVGSFKDYFSSLIGWERFRCHQLGIQHYCTIGLNPKEANNEALAEEVMDLLPLYLCKEGVVALGEVGYDDQTELEDRYFRQQLELAKSMNLVVLIHTPHRDKKQGTLRSMKVCLEHGLLPNQVVIDHNNEETVQEVLDQGFWAAFTIYPKTKMGNARMVKIVEHYGSDRIIVDSSADWGYSDPLAVPKTARLMRDQGIPISDIRAVCYGNALAVYGQGGQMKESDWSQTEPIDWNLQYQDNSVLRGQSPNVMDDSSDLIE